MWAELVKHHQEYKVTIHDRYFRMWTMDKAIEIGLENFNAFERLIAYLSMNIN